MSENKKIKEIWNGMEIIFHNFQNIKNNVVLMPKCELDNEQKINLRELESAAKQSFNDMHTVTSIFKSALRTALRDAPLAYLVNEDYKALLIEDYRKILNETIGLDFDYQILNNDLETVS